MITVHSIHQLYQNVGKNPYLKEHPEASANIIIRKKKRIKTLLVPNSLNPKEALQSLRMRGVIYKHAMQCMQLTRFKSHEGNLPKAGQLDGNNGERPVDMGEPLKWCPFNSLCHVE